MKVPPWWKTWHIISAYLALFVLFSLAVVIAEIVTIASGGQVRGNAWVLLVPLLLFPWVIYRMNRLAQKQFNPLHWVDPDVRQFRKVVLRRVEELRDDCTRRIADSFSSGPSESAKVEGVVYNEVRHMVSRASPERGESTLAYLARLLEGIEALRARDGGVADERGRTDALDRAIELVEASHEDVLRQT
ncbi:MAG: hypothetical protein FD180_3622 [Planctomycetota bacterium]|nr:MAG: hypothetical protein FD180_3622 [Planctomycetota bacterium]